MSFEKYISYGALLLTCASLLLAGCSTGRADPASEAPPPARVVHEQDGNIIQVDRADQFPLFTVSERKSVSQLAVTGTVAADISRTVPVISLASGRVLDIRARIGDTVKKGQVLMRVQSTDVSGAFSDYRKAVADELLARRALDRAKDLYDHGAIAAANLESAEDAEDDAKVTLETADQHLRILGNDPDHPSEIVNVLAPISGVITDQQVTNGAGVQGLSSPNPFTISDLSQVWVLCDVYENDLPNVRLGQKADIRLNAYPGQTFKGTISNIGAVLDPNLRTAKVRIQVRNPGIMKLGMFVTATFKGRHGEMHTIVPSTAVLHLRDLDWVFVPAGGNEFRRTPVVAGPMESGGMQQIVSGITPGAQVVQSALVLENALEQ